MIRFFLLALLFMNVVTLAFAFDQDEIQVHGFVSQGYLKSTYHDYSGGNSTDGSFEINEIGLNFTVPVTDELRFGVQFFSRDLMGHGDNRLEVDWAFLDYSFQDWLGVRAGKIKAPLGLYNRERDLDMLRTFVLLPTSIYSQSMRRFLVAIHGASVYGSIGTDGFGEIDYEFQGGTMPGSAGSEITYEYAASGAIYWNTPFQGVRFAYTYSESEGDAQLSVERGGVAYSFDLALEMNCLQTFSVEYEKENIKLTAEINRFQYDMDSEYYTQKYDSLGWYTSASWLIRKWVAAGVYYSSDEDKEFDETDGLPHYFSYQNDWAVSVCFNITSAWFIKIETHLIAGVSLVLLEQTETPLEKDWNLTLVKTGISF